MKNAGWIISIILTALLTNILSPQSLLGNLNQNYNRLNGDLSGYWEARYRFGSAEFGSALEFENYGSYYLCTYNQWNENGLVASVRGTAEVRGDTVYVRIGDNVDALSIGRNVLVAEINIWGNFNLYIRYYRIRR